MAEFTVTIVQNWHSALNDGRVDEMVALLHPQVEIGGPRGTARGAQTVREWFGRANIRLIPQHWFVQGNQVVVAQIGEWRSLYSGDISSQPVATVFAVDDAGLITQVLRYDALPAALEAACMTMEDEITV